MYSNDLAHTGIGAAVLTVVAVVLTVAGALMKLTKRRSS